MKPGEIARLVRMEKGWSRAYVAARVGTTKKLIRRFEIGLTRRPRFLHALADLLGMELSWFDAAPEIPNSVFKGVPEPDAEQLEAIVQSVLNGDLTGPDLELVAGLAERLSEDAAGQMTPSRAKAS